jgi:hypothetical protein
MQQCNQTLADRVEQFLVTTERGLGLSVSDFITYQLSDFPILCMEQPGPSGKFTAYQCDVDTLSFDKELLLDFHDEAVAHLMAMGVDERHLGVVCDHTGKPVMVYCKKDGGGYRILP